ncbi:cytochrome c3 family protein [Pedobacter sp. MW01-1-1]|uniref:cytochrome c3 family protein n=1 Tax=Pedobacter sp. MW01-1-1 TaxID=3383027 RepID=UPI003FED71D5
MRDISMILKSVWKSLFLFSAISVIAVSTVNAQDAKEGRALFKAKCSSCHALDHKMTGPALTGVSDRHSEAFLLKWIPNNAAMIAAGDPEAVKLFNENGKVAMTTFPELDEAKVKSILAYIKEGDPKPAGGAAAVAKEETTSGLSIAGIVAIVAIAIAVLVVLGRASKILERLILQKQGIEVEEEVPLKAGIRNMFKNKKFVMFFVLCLIICLGSFGWMSMWETGVHQGYQPVQPIKFSHELHAGTNQIDCQYCHSGAFKSKNASIPSLNVCMNCHKAVQARDNHDGQISPEIMKIYSALGYDPETQTYDKSKEKPMEWVRVHNLPDFAYFNHSQHVVVAEDAIRKAKGLQPNEPVCFACHGPVNTMEEIYQYSPLTMKWCINCHKETDISGQKNNAFYAKVIEAHEKIKNGEKITPALLGGLECGKCHY